MMIKRICIAVFSLLSGAKVFSQAGQPDSNFHLYLLIGQSNMAGRGALPVAQRNSHPQILMLDASSQWVEARDPLHFDKPRIAGVGPGLSFAAALLESSPNLSIGLIPAAWGGAPIDVWQPGRSYLSGHPYDDAISRAKKAMKKGVLKGVLWHQGESDNDSIRSKKYLAQLTVLVNRIRTDLKIPDLPFIAGEIGHFQKVNYINPVLHQLPERISQTAVVIAQGLTDKGDGVHFSTASARVLGRRYATAAIRLRQRAQQDPPVVVLTFDDATIGHYTHVAPLLKKLGFGASFMISGRARRSEDSANYMNWHQIAALHHMGFEIGNHTGHHSNMTKLDETAQRAEIGYIEAQCQLHGIPKPTSFAYPGNRHDSAAQSVLKNLGYQFARTGGSKLYNRVVDDRLAIPSYTMGSSEKLSSRTWGVLRSLQPGQVLVFTVHGVADIPHPDYTTILAEFESLLHYMKDKRFKVIALRDLGRR